MAPEIDFGVIQSGGIIIRIKGVSLKAKAQGDLSC